MALCVPFFDGKQGKVLLSLLIPPLGLEELHLVLVVLKKVCICSCRMERGRGGGKRGREVEGCEEEKGISEVEGGNIPTAGLTKSVCVGHISAT